MFLLHCHRQSTSETVCMTWGGFLCLCCYCCPPDFGTESSDKLLKELLSGCFCTRNSAELEVSDAAAVV